MTHQNYFVYMLTNANRHTVLYIGITNNLERRAGEHSLGWGSAFARKYQRAQARLLRGVCRSPERH